MTQLERPSRTEGCTIGIKTGCGMLYVTYSQQGDYKEVFLRLGKCGACALSFLDGVGRLITFALNAGTSLETIIHALSGLQCPQPTYNNFNSKTLSCLDGVAQVLQVILEEQE